MKHAQQQIHTGPAATRVRLSTRGGFTLIETLVAIFIFSTALVALSGIAARGVASVNRAKEVVTAQFLAQEGLEIVRSVRDTTTLQALQPWDIGFSNCSEDAPCDIDYSSGAPALAPCTSVCDLWIENGIYTSNPVGPSFATKFVRSIWVVPLADNNLGEPIEYAVYSRVTWTVGTAARSVEVSTTLNNWQ